MVMAVQDTKAVWVVNPCAVHNRIFPGLRVAVASLIRGELAAVLSEQQAAFGTTEHKQFVETLKSRENSKSGAS